MKETLRLALWQTMPRPLDVAGNLQRLEHISAQAAAQGADVLVVPEMFLTGYDIGVQAVQQLAEARDGASSKAVRAIAARHRLAIAYGYPERDAGRCFNAAALIDAGGRLLTHHRKRHLFGDLDRRLFAAGDDDAPLGVLHGWNVALLICYDVEFPEPVRRAAQAGADVLLVPTANMPEYDIVPQVLVPARAYESQLIVAYANYVGTEAGTRYGGLSVVCSAQGRALATAAREETLLLVDCSAQALRESRALHPFLADLAG